MSDDTVRVAVRIRPLVQSELEKGYQNCLNLVPGEHQIQVINTDKAFTFNHVFPPETDQEDFYNTAVKNMVSNIFQAYGQTGSGKTYSMGTDYSSVEDLGVIPRSIEEIFAVMQSKDDWEFNVKVSFMELYQEQLYDLLTNKQRNQSMVDLREDSRGIKVVGATEQTVNSVQEALDCLKRGSEGRITGATAMNIKSSRSHAIFTLCIHQEQKGNLNSATTAKFHLVDLAGSERSKKTQATGERFREGVNINKGLLALGNVISQLGEGGSTSYIGYRDSKLTRLLQDSLGGNSMTLMIACVSPADYNMDETVSTLRYADRAKKIKNKPIVNQDPHIAEVNRLNKLVQELKFALVDQAVGDTCVNENKNLKEKNIVLQQKVRDLTRELNNKFLEIVCMYERAEMAEKSRDQIQSEMTMVLKDCEDLLQLFNTKTDNYEEHYSKIKLIHSKLLASLQNTHNQTYEEFRNDEPTILTETYVLSTSKNDSVDCQPDDDENINEIDEKHEEHTLNQVKRNEEVNNINKELAKKQELVSRLLKETSQLTVSTQEVQEMEQELKTLQAEKEDLLKILQTVQTNNACSKLAETRRKKVQELEKKISELTQKCLEQGKVIKMKEKSDQQLKNLSKEIQDLRQTRVKLIRQMRAEAEKFTKWKHSKEKEMMKLKEQDHKRLNQMARLKSEHLRKENVMKRKVEEYSAINKRLKDALDIQKKATQRRERLHSNNKENIETWVEQELNILVSTVDAKLSLEKLKTDRTDIAEQLKTLKNEDPNNSRISELEEMIVLRNTQIAELQRQILEVDQENRANTRWNTVQTMADAKLAVKRLFELNAENWKQWKQSKEEMEILKSQLEIYKNRCDTFENEMKVISLSKKKRQTERIAENNHLTYSISDLIDDSINEENDDINKDPDWKNTPLYKRLRKLKEDVPYRPNVKRSSDGEVKCSCKTNCSTRLCTCRKNGAICSNCNCNSEICENRDKENVSRVLFHSKDEINASKKARLID
ncbi:chromosome-associated kinesin KIF4 isoform X2 [Prorops nasuta]|uniref:chromosome-associated kinesin KIF4 isoform X2 n=1 Tax=Prorops nasuta TaxID=863751 RepID=UPI0034CE32B3